MERRVFPQHEKLERIRTIVRFLKWAAVKYRIQLGDGGYDLHSLIIEQAEFDLDAYITEECAMAEALMPPPPPPKKETNG